MNAATPPILNATRAVARFGFADWLARGSAAMRVVGPYAAIEILLPGGTLLALLFWMYRRHQRGESLRVSTHRLVEAVRNLRRLNPRHRDVTQSLCTISARS
jgi:hypothetical protein